MSVTVGRKPSDADAWLPSVDAVVSLLRTLARVVSLSLLLYDDLGTVFVRVLYKTCL